MTRKMFQVLDQVQNRWPLGALLECVQLIAPPAWALEAAREVVVTWTPAELMACRRQLPALVASLGALYQRWVVAASLALLLGLFVAMAAAGAAVFTGVHSAVLLTVVSTIVLPPIAICTGIARDYIAARALLAVCGGVAAGALSS